MERLVRKAAKIVCVALCEYQLMVVGGGVVEVLNNFLCVTMGEYRYSMHIIAY